MDERPEFVLAPLPEASTYDTMIQYDMWHGSALWLAATKLVAIIYGNCKIKHMAAQRSEKCQK